jgi:predicted SprT family Zn-dependent metalloprotease
MAPDATVDASAYRIDADCTRAEFLAVCKVYARDVVDAHDLTVAVSDLDWAVSTRAKRRAGVVEHRDGTPETIKLTWEHFESKGWPAVAATVRHELIHVHLLNEADDASHGERFRRLADRLDTSVRCERFADPKYWVVCDDCGTRLARYRRSKLVERPERYACGDCGGPLSVERNR